MSFIRTFFFTSVLSILTCLPWTAPVLAETDKFMVEGVVRKLDTDNRKITIKHGEIKNLEMPGMTMVFRLQEAVILEKIQIGDKVLFHVEKIECAYVITDLKSAP